PVVGNGEFGYPIKSPLLPIERISPIRYHLSKVARLKGLLQSVNRQHIAPGDAFCKPNRIIERFVWFLAPHGGELKQNIYPILRREISTPVNGPAVGQTYRIQRPAALPFHKLNSRHVNLIDIGPLLSVDLNTDKMFIHHRGDLLIFEAFTFHDMTPVAGGISDTDDN